MGLDILLFRAENGGEPELVRESQRRRGAEPSVVDRIIDVDATWRATQLHADRCRKEYAAAKKLLSLSRKPGSDQSIAVAAPSPEMLREIASRVGAAEASEGDAHHQLQVTAVKCKSSRRLACVQLKTFRAQEPPMWPSHSTQD